MIWWILKYIIYVIYTQLYPHVGFYNILTICDDNKGGLRQFGCDTCVGPQILTCEFFVSLNFPISMDKCPYVGFKSVLCRCMKKEAAHMWEALFRDTSHFEGSTTFWLYPIPTCGFALKSPSCRKSYRCNVINNLFAFWKIVLRTFSCPHVGSSRFDFLCTGAPYTLST